MKRRWLAVATLLLASAFAIDASSSSPVFMDRLGVSRSIAMAVAIVVAVASLVVLLTSFDRRRNAATIRLDWFVPTLRRLKPDQEASQSLLGRWSRSLVPQSLQSDWQTKRRGWLRRSTRKLGLSWVASPLRRLSQTVCLMTFLVLFFYVCWPYGARPAPPAAQSAGWRFSEIDQQSGELSFTGRFGSDWKPATGERLFAYKSGAIDADSSEAQPFVVTSSTDTSLSVQSLDELSPDLFEAIAMLDVEWTLSERPPGAWPSHYTDHLAGKEVIPAEIFLAIDPLVSLSTAIASRSWVWSLTSAAVILIVCVLIPRGFCGYLCPLGTTIDLFDWAIAGRTKRFRVPDDGWWVHIKYYLLAGTLICAVFGVLVSGFFSAIPVITRAMLFVFEPLQSGSMRGWHLVPAIGFGQVLSILLFATVLSLGFLRPRFWCKYVCPSGAVFSVGNLFRATERKVESTCINCNKCVEICPFDAIKPDFTTRVTDCTLCQSCGGVCPTHAIKFVERWNVVELKVENDPPTGETSLGRRGFLSLAGGTAAAIAGGAGVAAATKTFGASLGRSDSFLPVRPPGSVPEKEFLEMCIRCGECFKVCPNNVLQPEGFQQGLEGLWTPMVVADWAGCESSCNACGQVCPTGAIRALPLEEKRVARMGLAIVNETTCLPLAGREECDLCVQECNAAGYHAIEFEQVRTEVDDNGMPIEGTGFRAPVVIADRCVGCGLCQTRCVAINVKEKGLLNESAIVVEAGEGKEDRMMSGSYQQRRREEAQSKTSGQPQGEYFVPEIDSASPEPTDSSDDDPFGLSPSASPEKDFGDDPFGTGGF